MGLQRSPENLLEWILGERSARGEFTGLARQMMRRPQPSRRQGGRVPIRGRRNGLPTSQIDAERVRGNTYNGGTPPAGW